MCSTRFDRGSANPTAGNHRLKRQPTRGGMVCGGRTKGQQCIGIGPELANEWANAGKVLGLGPTVRIF